MCISSSNSQPSESAFGHDQFPKKCLVKLTLFKMSFFVILQAIDYV